MRTLLLSFALTACYDKKDAARDLREMGVPEPYTCIDVGNRDRQIVHCEDGRHTSWECTNDGCVRIGRP